MKTDLLHSLLHEVRLMGSARIHKKKLLWLLGRKNEGDLGWELLMREWEEIGEVKDTLFLHWVGDEYSLIAGKPHQISSNYNKGWNYN